MGRKKDLKEGMEEFQSMKRCLKLAEEEIITEKESEDIEKRDITNRAVKLSCLSDKELLRRELIAGIKP